MTLLDAALACICRGWYIFPVDAKTNRPCWQWGVRATTDEPTVRAWWRDHPNDNIGIATKPSRLVVLDLDVGHVREPLHLLGEPYVSGLVLYLELCRRVGVEPPITYTVLTPSGGLHLYFKAPESTAIGNRPLLGATGLIDVRAAGGDYGGYVLAPGSRRKGGRYIPLNDEPVAPLPPWLQQVLTWRPPRLKSAYSQPPGDWTGLIRTVEDAAEGSRNRTLYWAASRMRDDGATVTEAIEELIPAYTGDDDGWATIRSAFSGENA
jgi:hypothetical protein